MKITFTFGSEEVDCEKLAQEFGMNTGKDEDNKITTTHQLSNEDITRIDELKKLKMEDLCREFLDEQFAEETVAVYWESE